MPPSRLAYLFTAFTILFWGGAASAFKTALVTLSPLALLWCATLISLLVIFLILISQHKLKLLLTLTPRQWRQLLLLGAINPFLYYVILFEAYDRLPGQVAMSLNYLWPLMLAILSVPILKQPLSLQSLVSILLSFCGALLIATQGQLDGWDKLNLPGVILALASTVIWAFYWLLSARINIAAEIKLFVGFLSGTLSATIYVFYQQQFPLINESFPWLAVIYVGLFEMGVTFFIWLKALQLADSAARIGNLIYLTPFLSLMLLSIFIHEPIHLTTLLGLSIIVGGILLQRKKS